MTLLISPGEQLPYKAAAVAKLDRPNRTIWTGVAGIAAFVGFVGVWAVTSPLDEAVVGSGEVVVSGNPQAVQTKDGGIVGQLLVHEGDHVTAGQVLIQLDVAELKASAQALSNAVVEQQALEKRLNAEMSGGSHPSNQTSSVSLSENAETSAARLQAMEYGRRRAALQADQGVLRQQVGEIEEQIHGMDRQLEANRQQQGLISQELDSLKDLADKGYVPTSRLRQLQRSQSELQGAAGQLEAERATAHQKIGENRMKMHSMVADRDADDSHTFRESEMSLAELQPRLAAAQQQIDRAVIRAPASGTVVGLSVFTVGGVVGAGQKLMEVVPDNRQLVVTARVKPSDGEALHQNQKAEVRISAFHGARAPTVDGVVTKVSADALVDEKTGSSFFRVEVEIPPDQLARLRDENGQAPNLKPGYPAEVVLPTRSRSAINYLFEPLTRSLWRSFRQH